MMEYRKLTEGDVRQIRRCRREGMALKPLATRYGVSTSTISTAALGERYAWVDEPVAPSHPNPPALRLDPWFEAAKIGWSWEEAKLRLG